MCARMIPVFFSVALLSAGAALAQARGPQASGAQRLPNAKPPSFASLFPNPTHNNGYEEWVQAADLIQNNANVEALIVQPDATLSFKRHVLADPAVAQALLLVRTGLSKPAFSPRTNIDENTLLPELNSFRHLGRLLGAEQYVKFADGRVDSAIESMRVGLAFGYRIQTDTLISGLIGVSVDSVVLKEFNQHLDQLSVYQCEDVRRIVEDFLNTENPAIHLLALEKENALKMLDARRADAKGLLNLVNGVGTGAAPDMDPDVATLHAYLSGQPADLNTVISSAQDKVRAMYDQALLNLSLPQAQRKPFALDAAATPDAALFRVVTIDPERILNKYTNEQEQLRILGVHALIHRYRWEHNALPGALTELHAAKLVRDSFTGSEIVYKRDGDRYTLTTQGSTKNP